MVANGRAHFRTTIKSHTHTHTLPQHSHTHTHAGKGSGNTHTDAHASKRPKNVLIIRSKCLRARTNRAQHDMATLFASSTRKRHSSQFAHYFAMRARMRTEQHVGAPSEGVYHRHTLRALSIRPSRRRPAALILCGCCW